MLREQGIADHNPDGIRLKRETYLANHGRLDLALFLPPPNSDEDGSEGGSSDGTSGGG